MPFTYVLVLPESLKKVFNLLVDDGTKNES